ncbi:GNAT family N-acetyltransferase [Candidatus Binatia bacterium]|nr:GNAT family N-acetyltransferase [Candidatus Binatia bacterium]
MSEPLDNAVWYALTGPLARFAVGAPPALRFDDELAPFGALPDAPDPAAWDALRTLAGAGGMAVLFRTPVEVPAGWEVLARMPCDQMLYARAEPPVLTGRPASAPPSELTGGPSATPPRPDDAADASVAALDLGDDDAAEMQALVAATRPGPFATRTHRLGRYIGVRDRGRLVAMAGERLRVAGATEISAVCTEPAYQRRGLAAALVTRLVADCLARGERAFLHVADDNHGARRVYAALGFRVRARVDALILRAPA